MKKQKARTSPPSRFPTAFTLTSPLLGIPLPEGGEIVISDDADHALFLQCCEVYRVIDLLRRNLSSMIETYSKYRTRDPFREALILRFFGVDESVLSRIDPGIEALVLTAFNRLHELKLTLTHADALPFTVRSGIEAELGHLGKCWDAIREAVEAKMGWKLKPLED